MRHSWIFEVLADLRAYAMANGLLRLAGKVDEVMVVARAEVAECGAAPGEGAGGDQS